jgi:hypothetical protein
MTKTLIGVLMLAFVTSLPAMADDVAPEAQAAISKALAEIGCTVEADDLDATADGYEADDVKCRSDFRQGLQDHCERKGRILGP